MCNRKIDLRGSVWTSTYDVFVADAGNETFTHTLSFPVEGKFTMETKSVLPPHPAMYRNPDGTVDVIPGHSSQYSESGTYTFSKGVLVLQYESGRRQELNYDGGGAFVGRGFFGAEECIFRRNQP